MPNTALNRTTQVLLTNKSGGAVSYGNVVIVDTTTDSSFTTTTTGGISTAQLGVVLEPNGIASNALGMVAVGGWAPRCTLNTAATRGQFIKSHTVAGQGTPHSSPQVEGDFAVALEASANPAIAMFGSPNGPLSGGSGTVTHTAGALTANAVVVGNASADITVLASLGTSGQVLTSNGAGTPPSFQAAGAGALVLLEQHTASASASLDFTTCITSTYDTYMMQLVSLTLASNAQDLKLLCSTNGGVSYDTGANYNWQSANWHGSSTVVTAGGDGASSLISVSGGFGSNGISNTASLPLSGEIYLYDPLSTTVDKYFQGRVRFKESNGGVPLNNLLSATYLSTTAVNAFQFISTSGNITSGTIRVYGLAK